MRTKRALTLLEIMIVICLITLITGAIGYNMKGALDKGRVFRTTQAMDQLKDLLWMCVDGGVKPEEVANNPKKYLEGNHLAKNSEKLLKDGWGEAFKITFDPKKKDFEVESEAYKTYEKNK